MLAQMVKAPDALAPCKALEMLTPQLLRREKHRTVRTHEYGDDVKLYAAVFARLSAGDHVAVVEAFVGRNTHAMFTGAKPSALAMMVLASVCTALRQGCEPGELVRIVAAWNHARGWYKYDRLWQAPCVETWCVALSAAAKSGDGGERLHILMQLERWGFWDAEVSDASEAEACSIVDASTDALDKLVARLSGDWGAASRNQLGALSRYLKPAASAGALHIGTRDACLHVCPDAASVIEHSLIA